MRSILPASRCVLAALILVAVAAAPASATATGSIGVRLLDAPVTDDPRARLYIVDHVSPGTVIERRIELSNTTEETARLLVYAAAATIEKDSFTGAEGHTPNELSTWTSVSSPTVEIPSDDVAVTTVTIDVPTDASPGEHYGVVWAEARAADDEGIVQVNRVGIRIYLSVGPGGAPAADFTVDSLTAKRSDSGLPMIVAKVHNIGGRALDLNGELKLADGPGGLTAGPFPATLGTTLPIGATGSVTILLDDQIPAGPWSAHLTLKSGLIERSAHADITFPARGSALPVDTSTGGWGLHWFLGGVAFLVLLAIAALLLKRREGGFRARRGRFAYEGGTR